MDDRARNAVYTACAVGGIVLLVRAQVHSSLVEAIALGTFVLGIGAIAQAALISVGLYDPRDGAANERHRPRSPH